MSSKTIIFAIIALINLSVVLSQPSYLNFFLFNDTQYVNTITSYSIAQGQISSIYDLTVPESFDSWEQVLNVDKWGNFYVLVQEDTTWNQSMNIYAFSKTGQFINQTKPIVDISEGTFFNPQSIGYDVTLNTAVFAAVNGDEDTILFTFNFNTLQSEQQIVGFSPMNTPIGVYDPIYKNYFIMQQGDSDQTEYNFTLITYNLDSKSAPKPVQILGFEQDFDNTQLEYVDGVLYIVGSYGWPTANFTLYILDQLSGNVKQVYQTPSIDSDYYSDYWICNGYLVFVVQPSDNSDDTTINYLNLNTYTVNTKLTAPFPLTAGDYSASWCQ
ncbi:hypothetical protein DLAC_04457 [Tieghemostelium lacteum]|uniref:Uncharacterized protein n=1 Tax=Tieghemostelium lacteum TaxID=361077 RepID=A0A151ZJR7_TIELA|nr:hypothetical protein DLAC_04457 [Tieghemostelium lacteum]|eukprot:KYQ94167.1 hypothetical protein DLAC_04457 [Tieghemostelium lacteum]